ncbi:putative beta-1,4-xylosyltransferase IRX9, partial [Mucuna pruriens]
MGSLERSRKKIMLWKKALVHFSLCFVMGFFTGFAPTGKSIFHSHVAASNRSEFAPQQIEVSQKTINVNRSWIAPTPETVSLVHKQTTKLHVKPLPQLKPRRLIIIVTPTSTKLSFHAVVLTRLANTIKLVPQPLLWIVVEGQTDSSELSKTLRKTGIMYRHLVSKENFTDLEAELNHQRNLALKHIVHHRLSGIVHFAELSNVYDLEFFQQLRYIEVFGTWPMALLAANRKKVTIEGPVCDSSQVIRWHLRNMNNETDTNTITPPIHISTFAFNSSILWDPQRWGRTSSLQDTSQNSIKLVKQVVVEDEAKLNGIPPEDCCRILLWRVNFHAFITSNHKSFTTISDAVRI